MKRGNRSLLAMTAKGFDTDTVSKAEFIFCQDDVSLTFKYPSDRCFLSEDGTAFHFVWEPEETWLFKDKKPISYDARMWLSGSDFMPDTFGGTVMMGPTLFKDYVK